MVVRKSAVGIAMVAVLVLFGLLFAAGFGRAASANTSTSVKISPHVLTAGKQGFITVTFTNSGPQTVNHVVTTVSQAILDPNGNVTGTAPLPLPTSAFAAAPQNCTVVASGTGSILRCDFGQVKPGIRRRVFSLTAPLTVTPFNVHTSSTFDESKGSQNTDTITDLDPYPFSIVAASNPAVKGECTTAANELAASNGNQGTSADPPALNPLLFPCTPLTVGVSTGLVPNNAPTAFGDTSFIDFLGDGGLATAKVFFFEFPDGITKNDVEGLYELARHPIDLTATDGPDADLLADLVPDCVLNESTNQFEIPADSGFISCVLDVGNLSGGGLVFTLLAEGGEDGGWGGIT
jgi:hypothetical protein